MKNMTNGKRRKSKKKEGKQTEKINNSLIVAARSTVCFTDSPDSSYCDQHFRDTNIIIIILSRYMMVYMMLHCLLHITTNVILVFTFAQNQSNTRLCFKQSNMWNVSVIVGCKTFPQVIKIL